HADAGEPFGEQLGDAVNQVVAGDRPCLAHRLVADMVRHRRGARAEDRMIGAALLDQLELVGFDRLADLVVGDRRVGGWGATILEGRLLRLAPLVMRLRSGGVMTVAIDDQRHAAFVPLSLFDFAAFRCSSTVPRVMTGSTPSPCSVRADSSISAA